MKGVLSAPATWMLLATLRNPANRSVGDKTSKPPETAMKTRLFVLAGLAIGFALPTFAQEQKTVDPETRQQIEAALMKFQEAFNKHDAAAIADLFALDAVPRFANLP
jgi:hypothetical protein